MSWKYDKYKEWLDYSKSCDPFDPVPPHIMVGKLLYDYDMDEKQAIAHCEQEHYFDNSFRYSVQAIDSYYNYWKTVKEEILNLMVDDIISNP